MKIRSRAKPPRYLGKLCIDCDVRLTIKNASSGGRVRICKNCWNELQKEWRSKNRQRTKDIRIRWEEKHPNYRKKAHLGDKCIDCEAVLTKDNLCTNTNGRLCKRCFSLRSKARYRLNPFKYKSNSLKSLYGISIEDYNRLLIQQEYKCGMCGYSLEGKQICIDHDHKTMKIRGLLCSTCNKALGFVEKYLQPAIFYLGKANGQPVLLRD
jgi:hypothetical protein